MGLDENNIKEKFLFNKIKIASEIRVSNTNLYKNTASKIGSRGRTCMLAPAAAIERIIKHTKNRENTLFMFPDFIADNSQGALKRIGLLGVKSEIYGASALLKGMEQADVSIVYAKGFSMDKKFLCYPGSGLLATLGAKTGTPLYVFVNSFNITTKEKANQMHFASISQKSHRQYSNINIVNQKYDLLSSVQISGVISDQGTFSPPIFVKAAKDKNMRLIKALS
ncbi:MAG: hypothetical protein KKF44_07170 [Nanoarchaeota archaeon]|nr:hypothetical protein [Nanoarchaeota archaeon]